MLNGIFSSPAFRMETLTDSINQIPTVPTQARSLGIFTERGIRTTSIDLEFNPISRSLIPSTRRGGPATQHKKGKRTMRSLQTQHFKVSATIAPAELQNVRQFGTSAQLVTAQSAVDDNLLEMSMSHDVTLEYMCIGAIKGVIYASDGSTVVYDLYDEFDVEQQTEDFTLGDDNVSMDHLCMSVKRKMQAALGGLLITKFYCFAGDDWFDAFVRHPDVKEAYQRWAAVNGQQGDFLRSDNRSGFTYKGITFENYIGEVDGVQFVPSEEAHFFPVGVPGLFRTVFAPADTWEGVNTEGLPRYAMGEPIRMGRGFELETESNPLSYCTQPECLVKGTSSTWPSGIND